MIAGQLCVVLGILALARLLLRGHRSSGYSSCGKQNIFPACTFVLAVPTKSPTGRTLKIHVEQCAEELLVAILGEDSLPVKCPRRE
jgi:hypothetical protein